MSDISLDDDDDDGAISVEYSSDNNSEPDIDLENQYYSSKSLKEDSPQEALAEFHKVLQIEETGGGCKSEWGFKALKQIVKIHYRCGQFDDMMRAYERLLSYTRRQAVTRNYSEKSINSILESVSNSRQQLDLLRRLYTTTLASLQDSRNDRLWFKTNAKLARLHLEVEDFTELRRIIRELKQSCRTSDGYDDLNKKGNQLLEIYALEIQMYTRQKDTKQLKALYEQSLRVRCAMPHPLVMGVIRECGGKMHLREGAFQHAHTDFFEAFKSYDEAGSTRRISCLKYLVLASMLMKSGINPFDSQETKPYMKDAEIVAMTSLIAAYHAHDIDQFETILQQHRHTLLEDAFIREHVEELMRNVRVQLLLRLVQPYTRLRLEHIARELKIVDLAEVDRLLVSCILDGLIVGRIDQANRVLVLSRSDEEADEQDDETCDHMLRMVKELESMLTALESRALLT